VTENNTDASEVEYDRIDQPPQDLALAELRIRDRQAERDSELRLRQHEDHAWAQRAKLIFGLTSLGLILAFLVIYICVTAHRGKVDPWAANALSMLVGAMAGYFFKR
jgi:hypothetical protein